MREKLIELFKEEHERCIAMLCEECEYHHDNDCGVNALVDHLIANGVTVTDTNVGKWIPVTERLPETKTEVLVYTGTSVFSHTFFATDSIIQSSITHWMPLPELPKGE